MVSHTPALSSPEFVSGALQGEALDFALQILWPEELGLISGHFPKGCSGAASPVWHLWTAHPALVGTEQVGLWSSECCPGA